MSAVHAQFHAAEKHEDKKLQIETVTGNSNFRGKQITYMQETSYIIGLPQRKYLLEKTCDADLIDQHSRVVMEMAVLVMKRFLFR